MANLLEVLQERILIADGATGTYLYQLGIPQHHCLEEVNVTHPDFVQRVYAEYADAGAQVVETNSFGANRIRLARYGLEERTREFNLAAVKIARDSLKGKEIFIGGSVGPLSLRVTDAPLSESEKAEVFKEHIGALIEGGCDALFLETFSDLQELLLALRVFKSLSSIPVITSLAVTEEGRMGTGQTMSEAFRILREAGADICSINGTCGLRASHFLYSQLEVKEGELYGVYPNAGKPEFYEGRFNYAATPEYFAENLPHFVADGVRLIGGDYGTTPAHVRAMAKSAIGLKPVRSKARKTIFVSEKKVNEEPHSPIELNLLDRLKEKVVTVVELDSPKTLSMAKFLAGAKALKEAGADAVTLADNSLAILRVSNFAAAVLLREKVGVLPLIHLACRDRNLIGLQSELMGLGVMGFRHLLAISGDPAKVGDHPGATSVYDVNSVGLLKLIKGMNEGVNAAGKNLNGKTDFVVGCAFNPNAKNFDSQVKKLEGKIAAGAQYVMTQPVFDLNLVKQTAERLKPLGIPVLIGVMPLLNSRNAEFLHNEVPGISIPDVVREKMRNANEVEGQKIGIEFARELRREILTHFNGVYLITPFLKYEVSVELMNDR
jgi:homocysteine S-methyltransferase